MKLHIIPMHDSILPYPEEFHHVVELDEQDYTVEDLGLAMSDAIERAHKHPQGPTWFSHFIVRFEEPL